MSSPQIENKDEDDATLTSFLPTKFSNESEVTMLYVSSAGNDKNQEEAKENLEETLKAASQLNQVYESSAASQLVEPVAIAPIEPSVPKQDPLPPPAPNL